MSQYVPEKPASQSWTVWFNTVGMVIVFIAAVLTRAFPEMADLPEGSSRLIELIAMGLVFAVNNWFRIGKTDTSVSTPKWMKKLSVKKTDK